MKHILRLPEYTLEAFAMGVCLLGYLVIAAGDRVASWVDGPEVDHGDGWL